MCTCVTSKVHFHTGVWISRLSGEAQVHPKLEHVPLSHEVCVNRVTYTPKREDSAYNPGFAAFPLTLWVFLELCGIGYRRVFRN